MEGVTFYFPFEVTLMEQLQIFMNPLLTTIMSLITFCGEEIVVVGVLAFLYWVWDKEAAVFMAVNVITGIVWNPLLKNIALRRRPYFDNPSIKCLKPAHDGDIYDIALQGFSFPSGHSTNAVILYGSLAYTYKKTCAKNILTVIAVILPLLIGLSRIMLGVHYPTDVLCGYILGLLVMVIISYLQRRMKKPLLYLLLLLTSVPGFFYCRTNDFYTCTGIMCGFFAANLFDDRFIRFKDTRKPAACVLRMAAGLILFFILNTVLKLPFPDEFLSSASTAQFLVRTLRYAIVSFLMLGLYPALFSRVKVLE